MATKIVVRSYECDSYGHVNNAVYLHYLEHARMAFLHEIGFDYKKIVALGYSLYVTHIDIFYKASAFLDDELVLEVVPKKFGIVRGTFHQVIKKQDGTLCAEADVEWASIKDGKPCKLPEEFLLASLKPNK